MSSGPLVAGSLFGGDFRIVRLLREGGMGAVYVVRQESTRKERALKVMRPELVANEGLRRRFEQEARVGGAIKSDHVVDVLIANVDGTTGMPFLVLELLRGRDLGEAMAERGAFPPAEARAILDELCDALGAAHAEDIVHRDVKPENVFLAEAKRGKTFSVKVLDFGIAKLAAEAATHATQALGSPRWMAPEQTEAGNVTPAADVWPLGLLAFQLLTGVPFWRALDDGTPTVAMILRAVLFDPLPGASARAGERGVQSLVPAGFDSWFARCVVREPGARFQNARLAFDALDAILERAAAGPAPPDGESRAPEGARLPLRPPEPLSDPLGTSFAVQDFEVRSPTPGLPRRQQPPVPLPPPAVTAGAPGTEFVLPDFEGRRPPGGRGAAEPRDLVETPVSRSRPRWLLPAGGAVLVLGALGASLFGLKSSVSRVAEPVVFQDAAPSSQGSDAMADVAPAAPEGMALIPTGTFSMGSNDGAADEKPVHQVTVSSFWMDMTEVTVAEYGACVSASGCVPAPTAVNWDGLSNADRSKYSERCNGAKADRQDHPINCVDWNQAMAYCAWAKKRLPTEEEWEYAARGTEGRKYPWGNSEPSSQLCWDGNGNDLGKGNRKNTCQVGSHPSGKSPFGLQDMAGNVVEWTSSQSSEDYNKPRDEAFRVIRGGRWLDDKPAGVRGARRAMFPPSERSYVVGFRCAR